MRDSGNCSHIQIASETVQVKMDSLTLKVFMNGVPAEGEMPLPFDQKENLVLLLAFDLKFKNESIEFL